MTQSARLEGIKSEILQCHHEGKTQAQIALIVSERTGTTTSGMAIHLKLLEWIKSSPRSRIDDDREANDISPGDPNTN